MHQFYFNECLPSNTDLYSFVELLSNCILEFNGLKNSCSSVSPMIVTEKLPENLTVCGPHSLADALRKLENKDLRTIAFSVFDKSYPISAHFNEDVWMEDILHHEFQIVHGDEILDATNLAIVAKNDGLLFSIPLNESLAVDTINLQSKTQDTTLSLVNLYGDTNNTTYVKEYVQEIDAQALTKLEQLRHVLGEHHFNNTFEKGFMSLSLAEQQSVIIHFERAKARNLSTKFHTDTSLIKDVTPSNGKLQVCELKIQSPTSLRIYFHEHDNKIYIASVEHKSNPDQNSDIVKAEKILKRLTSVS